MRHPHATELIKAAREMQDQVNAEPDPAARKKLIDENSSVWKAFREPFQECFGDKCWYTESLNVATDDDIDHFRPKLRVWERRDDHPGYWWLAFDWENFRLSSHRANRLRKNAAYSVTAGKGDHFPIFDEGARWMARTDICSEDPKLLDPTDPADPQLISFNIDGTVTVAPAFKDDPRATERVEVTRLYLHLDWPKIVGRRQEVYAEVLGLVVEGDNAWKALAHNPADRKVKDVAEKLIRLGDGAQEYSRAAVAFVRSFRDRPWIETMVVPNLSGVSGP